MSNEMHMLRKFEKHKRINKKNKRNRSEPQRMLRNGRTIIAGELLHPTHLIPESVSGKHAFIYLMFECWIVLEYS